MRLTSNTRCYFCHAGAVAIWGEVPRCSDHLPKDSPEDVPTAPSLEQPVTPMLPFYSLPFQYKVEDDLS